MIKYAVIKYVVIEYVVIEYAAIKDVVMNDLVVKNVVGDKRPKATQVRSTKRRGRIKSKNET